MKRRRNRKDVVKVVAKLFCFLFPAIGDLVYYLLKKAEFFPKKYLTRYIFNDILFEHESAHLVMKAVGGVYYPDASAVR